MSGRTRIRRETIVALLGDEALYDRLVESELVPADEEALCEDDLVTARVVGTLIHELDVNWPGVEVIVRLREELCLARRRQAVGLGDLGAKLRIDLRLILRQRCACERSRQGARQECHSHEIPPCLAGGRLAGRGLEALGGDPRRGLRRAGEARAGVTVCIDNVMIY